MSCAVIDRKTMRLVCHTKFMVSAKVLPDPLFIPVDLDAPNAFAQFTMLELKLLYNQTGALPKINPNVRGELEAGIRKLIGYTPVRDLAQLELFTRDVPKTPRKPAPVAEPLPLGAALRAQHAGAERPRPERAPAAPKSPQPIKRPKAESTCGQIWAVLDAEPNMSKDALLIQGDAKGWNRTTVNCQFRAWRIFHGAGSK